MSLNVTLWVTNNCNMDCTYCYEGHFKSKENMDYDVADVSIEYLKKLLEGSGEKECSIRFHGGEPLLNEEVIWYMIDKFEKMKIARFTFSLTTNALFISEESVHNLEKVNELAVSLDGDEFTHNLYRKDKKRSGTFSRVLRNSKRLLASKHNMQVRMTLKPDTVHLLYKNIMFLLNEGFKNIRFSLDYYDDGWKEEHISGIQQQLQKIKTQIKSDASIRVSLLDPTILTKKGECKGGITSFHIMPKGDIYPCSAIVNIPEFRCGDIFKGISEEWKKKLSIINTMENTECKGCNYQAYCITTRCKLVNYALMGEFNKPNAVLCSMENLKYLFAKESL